MVSNMAELGVQSDVPRPWLAHPSPQPLLWVVSSFVVQHENHGLGGWGSV